MYREPYRSEPLTVDPNQDLSDYIIERPHSFSVERSTAASYRQEFNSYEEAERYTRISLKAREVEKLLPGNEDKDTSWLQAHVTGKVPLVHSAQDVQVFLAAVENLLTEEFGPDVAQNFMETKSPSGELYYYNYNLQHILHRAMCLDEHNNEWGGGHKRREMGHEIPKWPGSGNGVEPHRVE